MEYICPICTEAGLLKCGKKQHMHGQLYTLWDVYVVEDGMFLTI